MTIDKKQSQSNAMKTQKPKNPISSKNTTKQAPKQNSNFDSKKVM